VGSKPAGRVRVPCNTNLIFDFLHTPQKKKRRRAKKKMTDEKRQMDEKSGETLHPLLLLGRD
jgi:hypothetical protein